MPFLCGVPLIDVMNGMGTSPDDSSGMNPTSGSR